MVSRYFSEWPTRPVCDVVAASRIAKDVAVIE